MIAVYMKKYYFYYYIFFCRTTKIYPFVSRNMINLEKVSLKQQRYMSEDLLSIMYNTDSILDVYF